MKSTEEPVSNQLQQSSLLIHRLSSLKNLRAREQLNILQGQNNQFWPQCTPGPKLSTHPATAGALPLQTWATSSIRLQYPQALMDLQIEEVGRARMLAVMTDERIIMTTARTIP